MAESTFQIPSTITIDNIVLDASSPFDSAVLVFNGTSFSVDRAVPVGTIEMWAGLSSSIPSGWLLCDGSSFSSSTYGALASVVGDRYAVHSGTTYYLPNMSTYIPLGITSGVSAGATTASYAATSLAHSTHTPNANATTNADGGSHTHTMSDGGSHNHSLVASSWTHSHNTGGPSAVHRHTIPAGNTAANYETGYTSHDATQHGYFSVDNAQTHSHTTGTQTSNANHGHTVPTSNSLTHTHTWSNSATSNSATATAHNHTLNIVPICFIIKF